MIRAFHAVIYTQRILIKICRRWLLAIVSCIVRNWPTYLDTELTIHIQGSRLVLERLSKMKKPPELSTFLSSPRLMTYADSFGEPQGEPS